MLDAVLTDSVAMWTTRELWWRRIDELCSYVLDRKHTLCSGMFPRFSPGFTDQKLSARSNQLTHYLWCCCRRRRSNRKWWNQADLAGVNLLALTQSSSLKQVMHFKAISSFYRRAAQLRCWSALLPLLAANFHSSIKVKYRHVSLNIRFITEGKNFVLSCKWNSNYSLSWMTEGTNMTTD